MLNSYKQVLSTYFLRTKWWYAPMGVAAILVSLPKGSEEIVHGMPAAVFLLCVLTDILNNLKSQLGRPQSSVMPRYREVHLSVALILIAVLSMIAIAGWTLRFDGPVMAVTCFVLFLVAAFGWFVFSFAYFGRSASYFVLVFLSQRTEVFWNWFASHKDTQILAGSAALMGIGILFWRFANLREELWGYAQANASVVSERAPYDRTKFPTNDAIGIQRVFTAPSDRLAEYAIALRSQTLPKRLIRRVAISSTGAMLIFPVITFLFDFVMPPFGSNVQNSPFMVWMFPTMLALSSVAQMRKAMSFEFAKPLRKSNLLSEFGFAVLIQQLLCWLLCTTASLIAIALTRPNVFANPFTWGYFAASLSFQLLPFALAIWCSRWTAGGTKSLFIFGLSVPVMVVALIASDGHTMTTATRAAILVMASTVSVGVGIFVLRSAFYRWMQTDVA